MSKIYNIVFLFVGVFLDLLYLFDIRIMTSLSLNSAKELFGIISITGAILTVVALINLYSIREIEKSLPHEKH